MAYRSGKDEATGARGSSAFRTALDAEFQVKRENENIALILACTKMKEAEESKRRHYDLQPVRLFTDEEGEEIHSLAVRDVSREVSELAPELSDIVKLTDNHISRWNLIRIRAMNNEICTRTAIRDDKKASGLDVKNISRWVTKPENEALLTVGAE
ncbi:hypothetical protein [Pantoea dispersa]|uniref:hypothetical protein n=1 Tax=Pantoea dispersa TaxID=59814 RepID=UPI001331202E|nr:hypothetical protein [Pantoea dispersa]